MGVRTSVPQPIGLTPIGLTLIGGPTLLIEIGGLRLLTDPTFDLPQAYDGPVRLVKRTGPAVSASSLPPIDAVLLSHDQHFDNLDHEGRALLTRAGRVFTTPQSASRLGGRTEGLEPWQSVTLATPAGHTLRVTATPARHGPHGFEPISGDVTGFVVTLEPAQSVTENEPAENVTENERTGNEPAGNEAAKQSSAERLSDVRARGIYVSGDTVWYEGVAEVARRFDIALAVLFAGAARPRGAFHVTMDGNDVVEATHAFAEAKIVAVHTEGWEHFSESEDDLRRLFTVLGLTDRLLSLERGRSISVTL